MRIRIIGTALLCLLATPGFAALRLPALFGDNMVLQCGTRTPIYGQASPREVVSIKVGRHEARAMANAEGRWRVDLKLPKPEGPLDLIVASRSATITYRNVLIGEVWLCSGQSNMEWTYHDSKMARHSVPTGNAEQPQIRFFKVRHATSDHPIDEVQGQWVICNAASMNDFSLLGYLFGVKLQERLHGGVGLIESDWGGTPAEAWTPLATLTGSDELRSLTTSRMPTPAGAGSDESRPAKSERAASVLYNAMIHPLMGFGFRGVAWYQGESNVGRAEQYRKLFPAMITAWRQAAGRTFPFLFVQLANFNDPQSSNRTEWAELRGAQMAALDLPETAMAAALDLGHPDEIHWIRRDELAKRLVWAAMNRAYHGRTPASGPMFDSVRSEGDAIRILFVDKLNGLVMRNGDGLCGFEIAGADGIYHRAFARIENQTIVAASPRVPHPVAVRYAWADNPQVSLYNSAGLPALPFRCAVPIQN